jgi:hypothetical protein
VTAPGEGGRIASPPLILVGAGLLAGLSLRLWLAWGPYGNYDQTSWAIVSEIAARGGNVYAETSRYNYGPIWSLLLALFRGIAAAAGWPLHFVVRGFLALVDVGNAILVGLLAREAGVRSVGAGALVYALSPVAILVVGYHGQFDNLAAFPLLLAALLALRGRGSPRLFPVWALATLALCVKHLCLFSVWMLLVYAADGVRKAAALMAGSLAVFGAQFLPWLPGGAEGIERNVLRYAGISRAYGLTTFLPKGVAAVIFAGVLLALPVLARARLRLDLTRAMELAAVALMALIPGTGEAYLILPAIWGAIHASAGFWIFSGVAYVFLLTGPNNLQAIPISQPWNAVWLSLAVWAALLLRDVRRERGIEENRGFPRK